jgi:RND family efflux transporter MFP subunit
LKEIMINEDTQQAAESRTVVTPDPPPHRVPVAAQASETNPVPSTPRRVRLDWRIGCLFLAGAILIPVWRGATGHARPTAASPPELARQPVAVARVTREDLFNQLTFPAEFRPYLQVELHAKVSGFLQQISVDIGDKVKTGQLLAKLEVPELQSELDRALAAEKRTRADYKDAHLVYTRLLEVDKTSHNAVAQQELDAAETREITTEAAVAAAKAEVEKYQTMVAYTQITAPFDGVVTRRYADPGTLIQAGIASATQSLPLVRLSDNYRLRLDFPVSVAYVKDIHLGDPVEVKVDSLGGKSFHGVIARCAQKVDEETRTMLTEIEVPNPNLEIVPGMYATLALKVDQRPKVLTVPTEAVSVGQSHSIYVINASDEIEERTVTLGSETPTRFEVVSGLNEGELVLVGRRSQVRPGQKVEPKLISSLARQ